MMQQKDFYRERLLKLKRRLQKDVSHLADEAMHAESDETDLSHVPTHQADRASDTFEQENTLFLMQNEKRMLDEIESALERIEQGTYGTCEECDQPVTPKARLKEIPYTRYCVECARKMESK